MRGVGGTKCRYERAKVARYKYRYRTQAKKCPNPEGARREMCNCLPSLSLLTHLQRERGRRGERVATLQRILQHSFRSPLHLEFQNVTLFWPDLAPLPLEMPASSFLDVAAGKFTASLPSFSSVTKKFLCSEFGAIPPYDADTPSFLPFLSSFHASDPLVLRPRSALARTCGKDPN